MHPQGQYESYMPDILELKPQWAVPIGRRPAMQRQAPMQGPRAGGPHTPAAGGHGRKRTLGTRHQVARGQAPLQCVMRRIPLCDRGGTIDRRKKWLLFWGRQV